MNRFSETAIRRLLDSAGRAHSESLESEEVEFKEYRDERALHNARDLAEELSALANAEGGVVVVGVRDGSKISGGQWSDQLVGIPSIDVTSTRERLCGKLKPHVPLSVWQVEHSGKNFVVLEIQHRPDTLVSTSSGKTCIRDGRSSRPMSPAEIRDAVRGLSSYDWSAHLVDGAANELLDPIATSSALSDFRSRRDMKENVTRAAYLEAIGATRDGLLTAGGLVFLGQADAIKRHLGNLECRFSWKTKSGELVINDVWMDCLWNTIQRSRSNFDRCNRSETFPYKDTSFTVPLLDAVAFHEAYLNALVHRDYSCEGMVSATYTGDQLVITSPGGFFGGVTAENIARHEPRHRNKILAKILMNHQFVDRAGMGVLRMGLGSLAYGRAFPSFRETHGYVEVRMHAQYFRPIIAVLTINEPDRYGLVDLVVLNSVYGSGFIPVTGLEHRLAPLVDDSWKKLERSVKALEQVELCGTADGVYVRVVRAWRDAFGVTRSLRTTASSEKYVLLYGLLKQHGEVSNADVRALLGHSHSSQTSKFLRRATYVQRRGSGASSRWSLRAVEPG